MTTFDQCIQNAIDTGKVKAARGAKVIAEYKAALANGATEDAAARFAVGSHAATTYAARWAKVNEFRKAKVISDRVKNAMNLRQDYTDFYNEIEYAQKRIYTQSTRMVGDLIEKFRVRNMGFSRDIVAQDDVVLAGYNVKLNAGHTVDPDSITFYKAVEASFEWLRQRANMEGTFIKKDKNFVWPINYDPLLMRDKKAKFIELMNKSVDWSKMRFEGKPILPKDRVKVLDETYENMMAEGRSWGTVGEKDPPFNKRLEYSRFFIFADGESHLAVQKAFGAGTPLESLIAYFHEMSRNIALMEKLGPNPATGKAFLDKAYETQATVLDAGTQRKTLSNAVRTQKSTNDERYKILVGAAQLADTGNLAFVTHSFDALTKVSMLNAAVLANMTDIGNAFRTLGMHNFPRMQLYEKILRQYFAGPNARKYALMSGQTADGMLGVMSANANSPIGSNAAKGVNVAVDVFYRMGQLTPFVQAMRWAFAQQLAGGFHLHKASKFADVPWKASMEDFGITEADWDAFRKAPSTSFEGVEYLYPAQALQAPGLTPVEAQRLYDKFADFNNMLQSFGVMEPDSWVGVWTGRGMDPNTLHGTLARLTGSLLSFPLLVVMKQLLPIFRSATLMEGTKKFASLFVTLSIFGAFVEQMKSLSKGEGFQPLDDKFLVKSILTGGTFGLFGDLLYAGVGRDPVFANVSPPSFGPAIDLAKVAVEGVKIGGKAAGLLDEDVDSHFARTVHKFAVDYNPVPWQLRLVFRRAVLDEMLKQMDPDEYKRQVRRVRRKLEERGQTAWWPMGGNQPDAGR